jgi:hypothetical protein
VNGLRRLLLLLGTILGGLAGSALPACAQTLRIVPTQPLTFGQVAPRQSRVIATGAAGAAVFTVQGPANASLVLTVTLPALLTGTSGAALQIGGWTGTVATGANGTPTSVVPVSNGDVAVTLDANGVGVLRIGATIQPTLATASGNYADPIIVVAREPSSSRQSLTAQSMVTASVLQPITVTAIPMSFPAVYSGTPATIAPEDVRALRVLLDGAPALSVDVTYESLPSALTLQGAGVALPIGTWRQRTGPDCSGSSGVALPGGTVSLALSPTSSANGRTAVCLGATVSPSPTQAPGVYTGTVTISVRYTGS